MEHWTVGHWILTCFGCRQRAVRIFISPNGVTQLMRIHLESLQRIARKRLADNTSGDGQARKRHSSDETQDRGGEPRQPPTDASNRQRARQHDEQSRQNPDLIANQCLDILIGWLSEKADEDDTEGHRASRVALGSCLSLARKASRSGVSTGCGCVSGAPGVMPSTSASKTRFATSSSTCTCLR